MYRDPGYRDQWDYDVQHGTCPICGPPYTGGPGGSCAGCNPPVREYRFQCGATETSDDGDLPYCPKHPDGSCEPVSNRVLRSDSRPW